MNHHDHNYRPDIDGLRAVAVLSVLVFHAFPSVLPSGFIGVDIFFVISGYLITSILVKDLEAGRFSIARFYERRIKRIFPALLLVMMFCLCVGWISLTAAEYKQFGRYTAGGAAFLNNFLFWRDAGYFDTEAETKPLLHLWSLAIEEQFYLLWPLLLWAAFKLSRKWRSSLVLVFVLVLIAASLIYSAYKLKQGDLTGDFYSPLTRAWELLLGAALVFYRGKLDALTKCQRDALGGLGLALLVTGFVLIDPSRAFPGFWALLPCAASAALIAAGMPSQVNTRMLSGPALVWVGLISYPLYLWHWPLLSLARILNGDTPSITVRVVLLLLSVLLAYATYRLIERPIRFSLKTAKPAWLLGLAMLAMLFVGYGINRHKGLEWRHESRIGADPRTMVVGADRDGLRRECGIPDAQRPLFEWCLSQQKSTPISHVVIGDSKAEAIYYGLARESSVNQHWALMGSLSVLGDKPVTTAAIDRIVSDPNIQWVVLANTLVVVNASNVQASVERMTAVIAKFEAAGKRVMFLIDNPTLPHPSSCISGEMTQIPLLKEVLRRNENPRCRLTVEDHIKETAAYQSFIQSIKTQNPHLLVFDPIPLLCASGVCEPFEGKNFLYSYSNHISDYANSKLAIPMLQAIEQATKQR